MYIGLPALLTTSPVVVATPAPKLTVPSLVKSTRRIEPPVVAKLLAAPVLVKRPVAAMTPFVEETEPELMTASAGASPKKRLPEVEVTVVPAPMFVFPLTVKFKALSSTCVVPAIVVKFPPTVAEALFVTVPAVLSTVKFQNVAPPIS